MGGRHLVLRTADTFGQVEQVRKATAWLLDEERALALIGETSSMRTITIATIAEALEVPLDTSLATSPAVTVDGGSIPPEAFRACFIDRYQGRLMARFARGT